MSFLRIESSSGVSHCMAFSSISFVISFRLTGMAKKPLIPYLGMIKDQATGT